MDKQELLNGRHVVQEAHSFIRHLIVDHFDVLFYKHFSKGYNGVFPSFQLSETEASGGHGHEGIWIHTMSDFTYDKKRVNPILTSITLEFKGEITPTERKLLPIEVLGRPIGFNSVPIPYSVNGQVAGSFYHQITIRTLEALRKVPTGVYNKMVIETLQFAFDKYQLQLMETEKCK